MAKKNDDSKRSSPTGKSESKQEHKKYVNLGKEKKRDTDDTGPRDKK